MRNYILTVILMLMVGVGTASARKQQVEKMYMFGMAAAFTDTIVHFTNIQTVDSAWIESKNNFLQGRDSYSYQLREYLRDKKQSPNRTCIVFYSTKRDKLEKKYQKMQRLYGKDKHGEEHFDVRYITDDEFKFQTVKYEEEKVND
ncbi:MAG: hypothetical protein K6B13_00510 [Prevotella sp.]|nr:hypothetical protein [Prevotella sp.]